MPSTSSCSIWLLRESGRRAGAPPQRLLASLITLGPLVASRRDPLKLSNVRLDNSYHFSRGFLEIVIGPIISEILVKGQRSVMGRLLMP